MNKNVIDNITVLAGDDEQARIMRERAERLAVTVEGTKVWDGPCPDGSFVQITPSIHMSTAEFYTLRSVSELPLYEAILFIDEMCGLYETNLTNPRLADGEINILDKPRTTGFRLFLYLSQVADTEQGTWALFALAFSEDGLGGPIAAKRTTMRRLEAIE